MGYDRRKVKEHRALLAVLLAARRRYDAARTPAAVATLSARTPALREEAHRRITAIDHRGVNSRLLPDYQELLRALSETYPRCPGCVGKSTRPAPPPETRSPNDSP